MHVSYNFFLFEEGREAIVMHPSYPMYNVLLKLHNIKYKSWKFTKNFDLNIKILKIIIKKQK